MKYTKGRLLSWFKKDRHATNLAEQTSGDIPLIMNQLGHSQSDISLLYINTTREKQRLVG